MKTYARKKKVSKERLVGSNVSQNQSLNASMFQFVDDRPEALAQQKLQGMAENSSHVSQLVASQKLADSNGLAKGNAQFPELSTKGTIQRLIVNTGDGDLLDDSAGDRGWITSSTLKVALDHGPSGQDIIELGDLAGYHGLAQDENIYFVGHGRNAEMGTTNPATLARETGLMLPEKYHGQIISLNCSSGQGVEHSAVDTFTGALNLSGIMVEGPRGPSLHHPDIPGKVRVIIPKHVHLVAARINKQQGATQDAWIDTRDRIVKTEQYKTAKDAEKIKILAAHSVALSSKFYRQLVLWADSKGYLYGLHESHTVSRMETE